MQEIKEYQLTHGDYKLKFLNIGAVITEFSYKGHNVVLSFEDKQSYRNNSTYMGSIVGRSAGRIRDGKLDGWMLPLNQEGKHNLHGNHIHYKFYDVDINSNKAVLTLFDEEGDFPGNALIKVIYELTEEGLVQTFDCKSDKPTVFNMTNHSYFNLDGGSILDHKLLIESAAVLKLDEDLLPVGTIDVGKTAFDFNHLRLIRDSFNQYHDQFEYSKFIDHPYKLDGKIELQASNLKLSIETDQDYLVVYAGNYIGDEKNKLNNDMNEDYQAICLETQAAPGTIDLVTEYKAQTKFKISTL